jgi:hypothetical protein
LILFELLFDKYLQFDLTLSFNNGTLLDFFDVHPDVAAPKNEVNFFNKYYE